MYYYKFILSAECTPRKHKNEHNRQKIGEMPKSIMSKFWSIIDSSLSITAIKVRKQGGKNVRT